jgi:hypothetical protein
MFHHYQHVEFTFHNSHVILGFVHSTVIFGVFRVKNHDFTPKNHIFPILGGAREIFGIFHVKNHDFTPNKSYLKEYF